MARVLRRIRRARDWTGADMASYLGVHIAYLCNIENCRQPASVRQFMRFAEMLEVPPYPLLAASLEDAARRHGMRVRVSCRAKP